MKSTTEADQKRAGVRQFFADRAIRSKLAIGFGALLLLGFLNIALYYWGAHRRSLAWQEVQQAIQRQIVVTDVLHELDDQKKYVDVLTSVIGVQDGEATSAADQERFAQGIDTIVAHMFEMVDLAPPVRRETITALVEKTQRLGDSWKRFYRSQWTDPAQAIAELYVNAEPLAEELLTEELPDAVAYEKAALVQISADFVETDRAFTRIVWMSFLLSALLGGGIAVVISRDVLRKISVLKTGAQKLGSGDLEHRIAILGGDELGDVALSFNDMATRLKERSDELATQRDQIEAQRDDLRHALKDLRVTQARLVQQEKLASLGALTAGIAHEIKNPLNFINNFAALCEELSEDLEAEIGGRAGVDPNPDEIALILKDLKTNAAKIREHGERADGIVRSMLVHSRGQSGERRRTDINALVQEYLNLAYHGMRVQNSEFTVEIERKLDDRAGELPVVPQELGRVLINLINNAFYAVYKRAETESDDFVPHVSVETERFDRGVRIRIADNGCGIPDHVKERVFEPFYTTKPTGEGTGLGLSLSYDIITHLHEGTIEVDSEVGNGTCFTVDLPDHGERAES